MTASGVSYTPTGVSGAFAADPSGADAFVTAMYSLPAFYRNNGTWIMNGLTLGVVRKMKDSYGHFLWQPPLQAGQPDTLLGRPVIEAPDMPDVGVGTYPVLFGDIGRAYRIYDRVSLALLRDPFTMAKSGLVRFHARRRVGGMVVLAEALRKIRCATS